MKRAVLFDMDGVITDTERFYVEGNVMVLERAGISVAPMDLAKYFGSTLEVIWTELKGKYGLPESMEYYVTQVHEYRDKCMQDIGLYPMPGVLTLIRELHKKGAALAVTSSSTMEIIKRNVKELGIEDCFRILVSGIECEHSKPAPDIYLKAAELLRLDVDDCVVIEDSVNGVKAGKSAGMYVYGYAPAEAYPQDVSLADQIITNYSDWSAERILNP